ncbi:MAG TPA: MarR family transcriptional regulator [Steroidobacteraceae bacterium]|jgi:MarR family transcriptional repressor of emrRAB|nr:MarR family transcriptional regulator [Steroidobacteraceae bacterium]
MQINNSASQFELVEANLDNLRARVPDLPVSGILLCRLLMHIGREMAAMFEQQIRPFGLAEAEFRVLTTLFSQPDGAAHPSDLCVRASQSPANMSRISDALVNRGLITRVSSVHDRRRLVLRITEEGEAFVRQLLPKLFVPLRELLKGFPEGELRQMTAQLKRLGVELDQVSAVGVPEPAL